MLPSCDAIFSAINLAKCIYGINPDEMGSVGSWAVQSSEGFGELKLIHVVALDKRFVVSPNPAVKIT